VHVSQPNQPEPTGINGSNGKGKSGIQIIDDTSAGRNVEETENALPGIGLCAGIDAGLSKTQPCQFDTSRRKSSESGISGFGNK